ncbi:MAG: ferredoxin [Bradymonadia bacterium]
MGYQIKVLRDMCIGAATCVAEAPSTFDLDDEDIAVITDPAGDTPDDILAAAQGCPTDAIVIIDDETGEQVWPEA